MRNRILSIRFCMVLAELLLFFVIIAFFVGKSSPMYAQTCNGGGFGYKRENYCLHDIDFNEWSCDGPHDVPVWKNCVQGGSPNCFRAQSWSEDIGCIIPPDKSSCVRNVVAEYDAVFVLAPNGGCYWCFFVPRMWSFSLDRFNYDPGNLVRASGTGGNNGCEPGVATLFMTGRGAENISLGAYGSFSRSSSWSAPGPGNYTACGTYGSTVCDSYHVCGFYPQVTAVSVNRTRYQTGDWITATVSVQNTDCLPGTANVFVSDGAGGSVTISIPLGRNGSGSGSGSYRQNTAGYYRATASVGGTSRSSAQYTVAGRVSGRVYRDYNRDGSFNGSDENHPNATVRIPALGLSDVTDSNGFYDILDIEPGTRSVEVSLVTYNATSPNPVSRSFGPNQTINFGIIGRYTVTGNVFIDANLDRQKLGSEVNYTASGYTPNISITGSGASAYISHPRFRTTRADGTYTITSIPGGTFSVAYNNVPRAAGYFIYHPRNGPPPAFSVRFTSTCGTGLPTPGGTCSGDTLQNLNFGVHNARPWIQVAGGGVRMDNGWSNPIPSSADASCGGPYALVPGTNQTNPGVFYSGDTASFFHLGQISQNPYNFHTDGTQYQDVHSAGSTGTLRTSYNFVLDTLTKEKVTPTNLATTPNGCAGLNCTLTAALPGGNYRANGNMTLNGNSVIGSGNATYIILVNGNLRINGPIRVNPGNSVIFVVLGDITVARTVGAAPSCSATPQLQGIYSTDQDFVVEGINNCVTGTDLTLTLEGAVITNAALQGGGLQMNRNICDSNFDYPSFRIIKNMSHMLSAPDFLWVENNIWQEVAP